MIRTDRRAPMETRPCVIQPGFVETAAGSCLISTGKTRVICTASVEESVPPFLRDKGQGWVTAEYAMLPASTGRRKARDGIKKDGRSVEIQRLIGRSLRQAVDMTKLGERTITLDCDVLTADGGTRTASITGAYVALVMAVDKLMKDGLLSENPIISQVAAVSAGIVEDEPLLDLCYVEDSRAQTDMNFVMNHRGEFIELQGTGEGRAFTNRELHCLLDAGRAGVRRLMKAQREALRGIGGHLLPLPMVVVASGNAHKLQELTAMFRGVCQPVSMKAVGFEGGAQERGLRAGTENVPGIVGMGEALSLAAAELPEYTAHVTVLRDRLIQGVLSTVPEARLNGHPTLRLPGNANFSFPGVEGESLLMRLDLAGIACSSGSACTSGSLEPSHVLSAMGLSPDTARSSVRFSLGRDNTAEEIDRVLTVLPPIVEDLRARLHS